MGVSYKNCPLHQGTRAGRSFLFFLISCRGALGRPYTCPDAPVSIRAWTKSDLGHGDENRVASPPNIKGRRRSRGRRSRVAFDRIDRSPAVIGFALDRSAREYIRKDVRLLDERWRTKVIMAKGVVGAILRVISYQPRFARGINIATIT